MGSTLESPCLGKLLYNFSLHHSTSASYDFVLSWDPSRISFGQENLGNCGVQAKAMAQGVIQFLVVSFWGLGLVWLIQVLGVRFF